MSNAAMHVALDVYVLHACQEQGLRAGREQDGESSALAEGRV